ncbi:LysR family transcriptional regulator [Enterovirga rhinocerotis]|uniref:LysR family transcriptional regulator n=1 Tax=Enterovirga rhinocerotis TaxID=1339210 RepID=A0A4R7BR32_9HYPH|nr:LysR family transcriptional regulator [Enterovirga rhinocerotis]TDR88130.1 LysR family transcriptional regulator [Enterovirga rhinocerotis]
MNRYAEMLVFVRAAEDGSFSAAARNLALTPSAVSKLISRIEARLGVLLFRRAHRAIALTPEGETFYKASLAAIEAVEAADAAVFSGHVGRETLRIRSMPIFATHALAPRLQGFCRRHPLLKVEVQLRIDPGNLLGEGMDVAIQVGALHDSSLVARRFSSTRWIICAAPDYLAAHGAPSHPDDLDRHVCLNFIPSIGARIWTVRGEGSPSRALDIDAAVLSNQASMLMALARTGMGIVRLTEFQVADSLASGELVELFPDHQSHEEDPIYVVYQSRRHLSTRVRAFLDFLDESFSDPPPWRYWRPDAGTAHSPS